MTIKLGTNPIAWSNDDMREIGGDIPLARCLAEAREAGFRGIELGHKLPRQAPVLRAVLAANGLELVSGWSSMALLERDAQAEFAAMAPHRALLRALGCRVVIVAETSNAVHGDRTVALSRRQTLSEAQWPLFCARLSRLSGLLAGEGLTLAYHHHMGTCIQTEAEIDRLMAGSEGAGLLLDTGHASFAGADPVALARRHRARIVHVHCKDVRADVAGRALADDISFLDAVLAGAFTVPGDGSVDFAAVLGELRGYAGWLVVEAEQDPARAEPLAYARLGFDHLTRFARAAGMRLEDGQ
ncbi:MAG: myo-inosose-2 dehydratase [Rhodospirillales bacterium]|nr:myo-inosose-2 dehydratase [Rhodospirillales bacterium]